MKRLITLVSALAVLAAMPVLAVESTINKELMIPKKDQCLLFAKNCEDNAYVIQQRIDRLRGELGKGTSVYSDDELNILRKKLDDAQKALEFVFTEGA